VTRIVEVVPAPLRIALASLIVIALGLLAVAAVEALRVRAVERRRRVLAADIGLLQSALAPVIPPRIGATDVSAAYRPAAGPAAGGDFFDAFPVGAGRTAILVGDVAGHGRDAVPLTASVRYTVRAYLEAGLEPRMALQLAGEVLGPQLRGRMVTVVAAIHDPAAGSLTYAAAGHPPPVIVGADEAAVLVAASAPLGAGVSTGHRQSTIALAPGAAACFYTDGLMDLRRNGARLGFEGAAERLHELVPDADARAVLAGLTASGERRIDDMALVIVRSCAAGGSSTPAVERVEELEVVQADLGERIERFLAACGVADDAARTVLEDLQPGVVLRVCGGNAEVLEPAPAGGVLARRSR